MGLPAETGSSNYSATPSSSSVLSNLPVGAPKKLNPQTSTNELSQGTSFFSNNDQNDIKREEDNISSGAYLKQELDEHQMNNASSFCTQNYKLKQEHQYSSNNNTTSTTTTYHSSNINTVRRIEEDLFSIQIDKMLLNPSSETTFEFEKPRQNESSSAQDTNLSSRGDGLVQQPSRSSSSASLIGIEGNMLMSIEQQSYEQEEYLHNSNNHQNNQTQTVHHQREHIPSHSQPINGHHQQQSGHFHQSQSNQRQQQQQQRMSSQSDHQLMISSHNNDFLTYNYNEHENICSDGWSTLDSHSNNNCSSRNQHQIESAYTCDSPFRLNMNMGVELNVDHQLDCAIQTYSYSTNSNAGKISSKSLNDFNNNQSHHQLNSQQLQVNPSFSNLVPVSVGHSQDRVSDSYCMQSNNQEQFFPNSTFYSDTIEVDASNFHHHGHPHQHQQQQYQHNGYELNNRRGTMCEFEVTANVNDSHLNQSAPALIHSPSSNSINSQPCYEQQQSALVQTQVAKNSSTIKPTSCGTGQFQSTDQLYQTNLNLTEVQNQLNFKQNECTAAQQAQQPLAFQQTTSADQYQVSRSAYSSLQQLTMNCDNYANQVSTTTAALSTDAPNLSANKTRSLKGRRGRPRKKGLRSNNKVNGKLWEFIRDLLLNDHTNPSFIRWERREDGVFKFVQSDKVAKMWGERKQNPKMTYEKLSRAMRYYYKSKVLLPVFGRRLVYKFGPNATGWLPDDGGTVY